MEENVVKELRTYLTIDVYEALTLFAKGNTGTAFGKFDYNSALRILLMKSQYADALTEVVYNLDKRMCDLENKMNEEKEVKTQIPKGYREVSTLGDLKIQKEVTE